MRTKTFWSAALVLMLGACATTPQDPLERLDAKLVLLGEVHDHAEGHRLRLAAFERLLAEGKRPALLMEMLDAPRQTELDALLAASTDARATTAAIGQLAGKGWNWSFYGPFVHAAVQHRLPIVAANVGRDEARAVMRDGLAAHGFEAQIPEPVLAGLAGLIVAGHCGQVDEAMARRMAVAQVARDQRMARLLAANAERGAVLLAGNGHVRSDWGAPLWLPPALRAQALAIGVLEQGDATTAFDRRLLLPPQSRPDPCAALRR